jgi:cytochrome b pre-mRNA-processing protein 3
MAIWPFQRAREAKDANALLAAVSQASRSPEFYGPGRVPDTLEGRFEATTLFASLALIRLHGDGAAASLTQSFADALFSHFDAGLREAAVGDLSVPKRMRKLAGDFYGRLGVYAAALKSTEAGALAQAIGRNVLGDEQAPYAAALEGRIRALSEKQAAAPAEALLTEAGWKL